MQVPYRIVATAKGILGAIRGGMRTKAKLELNLSSYPLLINQPRISGFGGCHIVNKGKRHRTHYRKLYTPDAFAEGAAEDYTIRTVFCTYTSFSAIGGIS